MDGLDFILFVLLRIGVSKLNWKEKIMVNWLKTKINQCTSKKYNSWMWWKCW